MNTFEKNMEEIKFMKQYPQIFEELKEIKEEYKEMKEEFKEMKELLKKLTNKSLREIGVFLGRKDHSTVIHAFDKISESLDKDQDLRETIARIETEIHQ